ncbi:MAG: HAMP domain-containing sensor histidine kinase [Salinimicrobium sp.]
MKTSFKDRIAFYYMLLTALLVLLAFGCIYFIARTAVYNKLDRELNFQAEMHIKEVGYEGDSMFFIHKREWEEIEHNEVEVSPVYVEIFDENGGLKDKSPNLKEDRIKVSKDRDFGEHFTGTLKNEPVRQTILPLNIEGENKGFITTAMPLTSSQMVLNSLRNTLLVLYPVLLLLLFVLSRYLAGKNIAPIVEITSTTNRITRNNLGERVELPKAQDELHELSSSINGLLNRIEQAMLRERQFTSDASHELRTPLTSLRGNLEVLIRKQRTPREYEEKVQYSLCEIDRMSRILEQLLFLARLDSAQKPRSRDMVLLNPLLKQLLDRYSEEMQLKQLKLSFMDEQQQELPVPEYYANLIFDNLLSNAIKYSRKGTKLYIRLWNAGGKLYCSIRDEGIGIKEEELQHIFNPFFRAAALEHKDIKGNGLGLSIVKKAADSIGAEIELKSELGNGTEATVTFPKA